MEIFRHFTEKQTFSVVGVKLLLLQDPYSDGQSVQNEIYYNSLNNDAGVTNLGKQTGHLKLWLNAESKLSECSTLQFQYFHQLEYLWMLCMTSVCRRSRRHVFIIPNIRELHMHCNNISIKPLFDKQHLISFTDGIRLERSLHRICVILFQI